MVEDSVFTKIIKGEIPSHKVYEDEYALAFMDIHPIQPGHVTVVSKVQTPNFHELGDEQATGFWKAVQKVGRRLSEAYPEKRKIAVQLEGLEVEHVHAKLFPFDNAAEFHASGNPAEPDHAQLSQLAEKLRFKE